MFLCFYFFNLYFWTHTSFCIYIQNKQSICLNVLEYLAVQISYFKGINGAPHLLGNGYCMARVTAQVQTLSNKCLHTIKSTNIKYHTRQNHLYPIIYLNFSITFFHFSLLALLTDKPPKPLFPMENQPSVIDVQLGKSPSGNNNRS